MAVPAQSLWRIPEVANYYEWVDSYIHDDLVTTPRLLDVVLNSGFESGLIKPGMKPRHLRWK